MAPAYVVLFLFFIFQAHAAEHQSKLISLGSSLSPINKPSSWLSHSGRVAFGFYKQGSGFSVGSWLTTTPDITIVWTANRNDPPVSSNAILILTMDGQLILRAEKAKDKFIAKPSESASFASISDLGNFELFNERSHIIWSSFDVPTDTILGGQSLYAAHELISSVSETNSSTGRFRLKMQEDGNFVSYPTNTIDEYPDAFWSSGTYGYPVHLFLNYTGELVLIDNSSKIFQSLYSHSSSYNSSIIYRATLGHDGIFRLYAHYSVSDGMYKTSVLWRQIDDPCLVKTFCGPNSYCTLYDDQPRCQCLPGTDFVDPEQMSSGCERYSIEETCEGTNKSAESYNMTSMMRIRWDDYPYFKAEMTEEDCRKSCLEDCNCDAALYKEGYCTKQKLPLKSARRDQGEKSSAVAYFKLSMRNITSDEGVDIFQMEPPPSRVTSKKANTVIILPMTSGFITCSCIFLAIAGFFILKYRVARYKWLLETGNFGVKDELSLRSFSYGELKRATNGFKESLGMGSFGSVYKGSLYKGQKLVAVKRLEKVMNERSEREFHAEMHVIGRIHHRNLVRLLGYCSEDSKRLLVYEYMSNGSLADLLFFAERVPDWNERVRIALDVARGILYLHDECEAPIIHCDIKPQNILMDDFWTAKISDFGLAKLLMPDQTRTFTLVRGTRGYMAPEWSKNIPISVRADVYSYGVVLLEIVCCRRNLEINASNPEEMVLINWVYKSFISRQLNKLVPDEEVDKKTLENIVKVGLWCVQDEAALRPSMKSVVMMLGGITDVSVPPCPTAS